MRGFSEKRWRADVPARGGLKYKFQQLPGLSLLDEETVSKEQDIF
jgi:hypothetical protein